MMSGQAPVQKKAPSSTALISILPVRSWELHFLMIIQHKVPLIIDVTLKMGIREHILVGYTTVIMLCQEIRVCCIGLLSFVIC